MSYEIKDPMQMTRDELIEEIAELEAENAPQSEALTRRIHLLKEYLAEWNKNEC